MTGDSTRAGEPAANLATRKAELRTRMRALRASIPAPERARMARAAAGRLLELPAVGRARTVLLFSSFGSEISVAGIAQRLADDGRTVLLPFLREGVMAAARLRPGEALAESGYGPREPPDPSPGETREVDVAITPGLAFDRRGYRLGYGGGHYDRYLAGLGEGALRIGIGFDVQLVDEVPHGRHDVPLDLVVTDRRVLDAGAARGTAGGAVRTRSPGP